MKNIINKIFGKKYILEITSKRLDENIFWNIIDLSLKNTSNIDDQEIFLIKEIEKLTPEEIIGFKLKCYDLINSSFSSELWCAGYIMNNGCSDDGFEDFREWIISRGKNVYYGCKKNPDTLVLEVSDEKEYYWEGFSNVADVAFENKTKEDIYDYIPDDCGISFSYEFNIKLNWEEKKPETMKSICPKLFEKFWSK